MAVDPGREVGKELVPWSPPGGDVVLVDEDAARWSPPGSAVAVVDEVPEPGSSPVGGVVVGEELVPLPADPLVGSGPVEREPPWLEAWLAEEDPWTATFDFEAGADFEEQGGAGRGDYLPADMLACIAPGLFLAGELEGIDARGVDDYHLVEMIAGFHRLAAWSRFRMVELAGRLSRRTALNPVGSGPDGDFVLNVTAHELAPRLGVSRFAAQRLVDQARLFGVKLQDTGVALQRGWIDAAKADVIVRLLKDQPDDVAWEVQQVVLPDAAHQTVGQVERAVSRAIIAIDPLRATARHKKAREQRRVNHPRPLPDGMASMWAVLPATDAAGLDLALEAAARSAKANGDTRTIDQLRADALALMGHGALDHGFIGTPPTTDTYASGESVPGSVADAAPTSDGLVSQDVGGSPSAVSDPDEDAVTAAGDSLLPDVPSCPGAEGDADAEADAEPDVDAEAEGDGDAEAEADPKAPVDADAGRAGATDGRSTTCATQDEDPGAGDAETCSDPVRDADAAASGEVERSDRAEACSDSTGTSAAVNGDDRTQRDEGANSVGRDASPVDGCAGADSRGADDLDADGEAASGTTSDSESGTDLARAAERDCAEDVGPAGSVADGGGGMSGDDDDAPVFHTGNSFLRTPHMPVGAVGGRRAEVKVMVPLSVLIPFQRPGCPDPGEGSGECCAHGEQHGAVVPGAEDGGKAGDSGLPEDYGLPEDWYLGPPVEVAELQGYGPITPDVARALAHSGGTWQRLVSDPVSGELLDVGRTRYRPPAPIADFVRNRDGVCVRPGCSAPAEVCDLDHVEAWEFGGVTSAENLAPLCKSDHSVKTIGAFELHHLGGGVFEWTTPTGHHYRRDRHGRVTPLTRWSRAGEAARVQATFGTEPPF